MQVKIQAPCACDDTSMNAIRLTCSDGTELISDNEGEWGTWGNKVTSPYGIFGVTFRTERDQDNGDDTAANGIRFKDMNDVEYSPGDGNWGDWSGYFYCNPGTVVSGLRLKIQTYLVEGDDTALNEVQFYCGLALGM